MIQLSEWGSNRTWCTQVHTGMKESFISPQLSSQYWQLSPLKHPFIKDKSKQSWKISNWKCAADDRSRAASVEDNVQLFCLLNKDSPTHLRRYHSLSWSSLDRGRHRCENAELRFTLYGSFVCRGKREKSKREDRISGWTRTASWKHRSKWWNSKKRKFFEVDFWGAYEWIFLADLMAAIAGPSPKHDLLPRLSTPVLFPLMKVIMLNVHQKPIFQRRDNDKLK